MRAELKRMLYKLFGKTPYTLDYDKQITDVREYQDTTKENFTAIFSNALVTLAVSDSSASVSYPNEGQSLRAELLNNLLQKSVWPSLKEDIAIGTGSGMIIACPYIINGKLYFDVITKDKFWIINVQGNDILGVVILSDEEKIDNRVYTRWTEHYVESGVYHIINRAVFNDTTEVPLSSVPKWENILPEVAIQGVDRLPLGIYRCPTSNRRPKSLIGVPITYGAEVTLNKIAKALMQIDDEFEEKGLKVFADSSLFKNNQLSKVYKKTIMDGKLGSGSQIDVFDPAFRDSALFANLNRLFAQLEHEVGTSKGILTELTTSGGTATEIRRAMLSTFALCDDIRSNIEKYLEGLFYGFNILANYYSLTPQSDYVISYDWSYSLLEDPQMTWQQYKDLHSIGGISTAEMRSWVKGEDLIDAIAAVAKIEEENPPLEKTLATLNV